MGYSVGDCNKHNRFIGYGVLAYCDHPGCKTQIDRGMSYACCGDKDHMSSCSGFYCAEHEGLCTVITEDEFEEAFDDEIQEQLEHYGLTEMPIFDEDGVCYHCQHEPIDRDKEHPDWLKHVLSDESWQQWRDKNLAEVERYKDLLSKCQKQEGQ